MPKDDIDYSNTIIYKINCNDETINDVYVGHTTNFTKRKYLHKYSCANLDNKLKIYDTIRKNGGWDNWNMCEIAIYNCKNKTEARIKEQQHYDELKANLNIYPPFQEIKYFECEKCDYKCSKQSEYTKHILTNKHKILQNPTSIINTKKYICECGKVYKHSSTLYAHKKNCNFINEENTNKEEEKENIIESENNISPELILNIIQQNQEFKDLLMEQNNKNLELQKQMLEVIKNGTNNTNISNSNNKTFNLQVFLNETCKDAMNIMDFVDSIKIQLSDIESIGELGYVNGMSKLIIKHLNALDENMRPVHCSDPKRDSLYVKDQNVWEKEDPDNKKIKKAIKYISNKNICALPEWKAKYPDCIYSDSNKSDQYNHIVLEAMGGSGDNDAEKADKIVKKIAKVVTIDKNNQ